MSFLGGALVGGVLGLGAGVLFARRPPQPRGTNLGGVAIVIAALALMASGIALARSDRHDQTNATAPANVPSTSTSPTVAAPAPSTTTSSLSAASTVSVPNVVAQPTATATATLEHLGLKATVETLGLANVPAGFVISQSPLPAALVPVGSAVSLVVSSAT
jgi:hypothetical protein